MNDDKADRYERWVGRGAAEKPDAYAAVFSMKSTCTAV